MCSSVELTTFLTLIVLYISDAQLRFKVRSMSKQEREKCKENIVKRSSKKKHTTTSPFLTHPHCYKPTLTSSMPPSFLHFSRSPFYHPLDYQIPNGPCPFPVPPPLFSPPHFLFTLLSVHSFIYLSMCLSFFSPLCQRPADGPLYVYCVR